ncbi:MAG: S41 family peptidase [Candidatus Marinamargulisbacteria bacterium]
MFKLISLAICLICLQSNAITVKPISNFISFKIQSFASQNVTLKTQQECQSFAKKPLNILIDLRSNQGGQLRDALQFSALFVTSNALIRLDDGSITNLVTRPIDHPVIASKKIIVLVNAQTASAAEASAHVLKKHPNTIIIGENTMGKTTIHRNDGQAATLIGFHLPQGRIVPDIFHRFSNQLDDEQVYLSAIAMSQK